MCPFWWEERRSAHCTLHTTNHLLGSPQYTAADFNALAVELSICGIALIVWEGVEPFHDASGNYDFQVMDETLTRAGKQEQAGAPFILNNRNKDQGALYADICGICASPPRACTGPQGPLLLPQASRPHGPLVGPGQPARASGQRPFPHVCPCSG